MGGNNDTARVGSGFWATAERLGTPEDYFFRLALDTLQVSVQGRWVDHAAPQALLDKRRHAEKLQQVGFGQVWHEAHDGRKLSVLPHGGRPSYQVLMRDGDGLELRALPNGKMPAFIFRFGARWCVENSIAELDGWMRAFTASVGYAPESLLLSEVHVRCDTPQGFTEDDVKRMRGASTRNGRFNTHVFGGKLSGIDNLGGKKNARFVIYDKRLEQTQKQGALWPSIWSSYGIPADMDVWRTEARWDRKGLLAVGLDRLDQLNERTIAGLWHLFTTQYLVFVEDAEQQRSDRTRSTELWSRIQACGRLIEAQPIRSQVSANATRLIKQATGCIAKAMAVAGLGHAEAEMEAIINAAVEAASARVKSQRLDYIKQLLRNVLENYPDEAFAGAEAVRGEIFSLIDTALSTKALASPYDS